MSYGTPALPTLVKPATKIKAHSGLRRTNGKSD